MKKDKEGEKKNHMDIRERKLQTKYKKLRLEQDGR